jgi:hypothetical protein
MIYIVEHVFGDPALEAAWNDWYDNNIRVLLGVPGFHTAQRFKSDGAPAARYMAVYNVATAAVFASAEYKNAGGGGTASQRFRPAYKEWVRNLFDAAAPAPAVRDGEQLYLRDSAELQATGLPPGVLCLTTVGLHRTTACRALLATAAHAPPDRSWRIYRPLSDQLCAQPYVA